MYLKATPVFLASAGGGGGVDKREGKDSGRGGRRGSVKVTSSASTHHAGITDHWGWGNVDACTKTK